MPTDAYLIELLGFTAAVCTTGAFLPQAIRVWRTRSADDLSIPMFALLVTGIALWLTYGILIVAWPIIIANVFSLIFNVFILIAALRFRRKAALLPPTP